MFLSKIQNLPSAIKQYLLITTNYWFFTLTDGALRMLVVLYFHQLGYSPIAIAMLFLFYEIFGVVTNLVGGWLGARVGLNRIMNIGLFMQVIALLMLTVPVEWLTIAWVMLAQALSGVAKDLNKMSAKSSIKTLVPKEEKSRLFHWVALLTGSKNTLKGAGFFLGAFLLASVGFQGAMFLMASVLVIIAVLSVVLLKADMGKASTKPKFSQMFSKSKQLNNLSAARLFLFAARDVWFVVALPIYLMSSLDWPQEFIGAFIATWIIVYGIVQASSGKILRINKDSLPSGNQLAGWALALAFSTAMIPLMLILGASSGFSLSVIIVFSLMVFGVIFAANSALHSYAIVAIAKSDGVSMDVGFYYMANAMGRLIGTILSGWVFQQYGLQYCLIIAAIFALLAAYYVKKVDI